MSHPKYLFLEIWRHLEQCFCFNAETKPFPFAKRSCHHCYSTVGRALETIQKGFVKVPNENRRLKHLFFALSRSSCHSIISVWVTCPTESGPQAQISHWVNVCHLSSRLGSKTSLCALVKSKPTVPLLFQFWEKILSLCLVKNFVPRCCFMSESSLV